MNSVLRRRYREYATARFSWDRIVERLEHELVSIIGKG